MEISITLFDEHPLVEISGAVDSKAAGSLYDALTDCVGKAGATLIVDLSHVSHLTHAGTRGLIVAAKLMKSRRGEMLIRAAAPSTEAFLRSLGFDHLLTFEPVLEAAKARTRLSPSSEARKPRPTLASRLRPTRRRVVAGGVLMKTAAVQRRVRRRLIDS